MGWERGREIMDTINSHPITDWIDLDSSADGAPGMYNCPICASGTGVHGTGALSVWYGDEKGKWMVTCFSCHKLEGDDTLAAIQKIKNLPKQSDVWRMLGFDINSDRVTGVAKIVTQKAVKVTSKAESFVLSEETRKKIKRYIDDCAQRLPGSPAEEYLHSRGFTDETIQHFKFGFDPWCSNKGLGTLIPSVVIPYATMDYYITRPLTEKQYDKPAASYAGPEPLYNGGVLSKPDPVFVVESQFCVASITQCGGYAVALGNTGGKRLLEKLGVLKEKGKHIPTLILSLDNDEHEQGQNAQKRLADELRTKGYRFIEANIAAPFKDPNELLASEDGDNKLRASVSAAIEAAKAHS